MRSRPLPGSLNTGRALNRITRLDEFREVGRVKTRDGNTRLGLYIFPFLKPEDHYLLPRVA